MTHAPTAEQSLILDHVRNSRENMMISARAGAAKTTTLEMIASAVPEERILSLAFNKKIAEEMQKRLPSNTKSSTLHSMGWKAWKDFSGKFPKLESSKCYNLLKEEIAKHKGPDKDFLSDAFRDLLDLTSIAKSSGYLPKRIHPSCRPLVMDDSFFEEQEYITTELERDVVKSVLIRSFEAAFQGVIDFDDMVYLPALLPVTFDFYTLVLVDEAQDLSPLNHHLVQKIAKRSRVIAVGDPFQAIYGFRGADETSMSTLCSLFDMRTFYLTICFRCDESIVKAAQWRAPDIQWRPGAPLGLVATHSTWSVESIADGDAIICRNNAPLFKMAVNLLRAKRFPELASGDIIKGLLAAMRSFGPPKMNQETALVELTRWIEDKKKKSKNHARVDDQASCLRIFIEETETLGDAITYLQDIANRPGRIKLMTGHKSKGLEFPRVWFLDQQLLRKEGQDLNLRYVIQTRALHELLMVESKGFEMPE